MDAPAGIGPYLRHLRLPYQLTLSPLFLWGVFLAGGKADVRTGAAFIALHLFLYPAATAFNSFYDRDEGPVGGMLEPPPVPAGLRRLSIALGAVGAVVGCAAGVEFVLLYLAIALLAAGYSHPRLRWKARPVASALVIALGQGGLGFLAGWAAAAPLDPASFPLAAGAAAASLTTLGLYPVTQIFQIEEDRARGDLTLAVAFGAEGALRFGGACLALAGLVTVWLLARRFGAADPMLAGAGYALLLLYQMHLARRLARPGIGQRERWRLAMRLSAAATSGFLLFILWQALKAL